MSLNACAPRMCDTLDALRSITPCYLITPIVSSTALTRFRSVELPPKPRRKLEQGFHQIFYR